MLGFFRSSAFRYVTTLAGATAVITLAVGLAVPASLHAIPERPAAKLAVRANYGQPLPVLTAGEMNAARRTPVTPVDSSAAVQPAMATPAADPAVPAAVPTPRYRIAVTALNIRSTPSGSGRVLASLPRDTEVQVVAASGSWRQIAVRGVPLGWAYASYMRPAP